MLDFSSAMWCYGTIQLACRICWQSGVECYLIFCAAFSLLLCLCCRPIAILVLFLDPDSFALVDALFYSVGMYVMVLGSYSGKESLPRANRPVIKVHKLVDLSAQPDRESMWYMEVVEAFNFFYLQFSAASPLMKR
jgi:hypothetical protein